MLAENRSGDAVDSLGRLGKFLSIPLDESTWRPLEPEKLSDGEQNALNLVLNAVRAVLGALVRF
jgi:hypothetical protein